MSDNLVLIGFMGCGKSSVGKLLAQKVQATFIDTDALIELRQNKSISEIFALEGEPFFRKLEQDIITKLACDKNIVISTGGGLPIFSEIPSTMKTIYIKTSFETILSRMTKEEIAKRPLFQDRAKAHELFTSREAIYEAKADLIIDAEQPLEKVCEVILNQKI